MSQSSRFFDFLFSRSARRKRRYLHATDVVLRSYLHDLQLLPVLTPEEEAALLARAASAEIEARHRLVEAHLRLVVTIAVYFQGRGLSLPELIQEGNLGLLKAIERFDSTKARRLSTYAKFWVLQKIGQALHERARLIHTPYRTAQHMEQIERVIADMLSRGMEPTIREIARGVGLPVEQVMALMELMQDPLSLQWQHDDDGPLAEILEAPPLFLSNEATASSPALDQVSEAIEHLSASEQQVIKLRFGLVDGIIYDYGEIAERAFHRRGKRVDERIRQIERSALTRLRVLLDTQEA
jgi:RNA polymerase primary sigma factor